MNLFIKAAESKPAREESRVQSERCGTAPHRGDGLYSVAQQSYREEIEYSKKREAKRIHIAALKVIGIAVGTPILLVAVFLAAYIVTCVISGATPEEMVGLLKDLAGDIASFAQGIILSAG